MKEKIILFFVLLVTMLSGHVYAFEKVYFYYTDPAGTPLTVTNENGATVWQGEYRPFGELQSELAAVHNSKKFVGKEHDVESGLYYFGARYMEARVGRFVSPDPVGPVIAQTGRVNGPILMNPQMLNVYAYALNNPYKYIDSNGQWPKHIHERFIDLAFSSGKYSLDDSIRDVLKAASSDVDRDANQGPDKAYEHAMSRPGQSKGEAEQEMNKFIHGKIKEYKMHMSKREYVEAYRALGQAMHSIMDSTSPSHEGFQVWGKYGDIESLEGPVHVLKERYLFLSDFWGKREEATIKEMRNLINKANE